ncbi:MAG: AzlC family ABC transporter permease [Lachnospiraceae bacterium]|nr:AzlC family ABC transporter permease [Lachnospiraceae bacterium]
MKRSEILRKAFVKSLPIMAGYVVLGMGFGILMNDKGYSVWLTLLCSLFIFAGSMQYITVDLLASAASPVYAAFMTLMVNARHLFYGVSMVGKYRKMKHFKPYLIFGLTDETYSLLCTDPEVTEDQAGEWYSFLVTAFNHSYWVIGSVLGGLLGSVLEFDSRGIDFSMTALFVTVFVEQWLTSGQHRSALTGIGASFLCLLVFGSSRFLIPAMVLIVVILTIPYRKGGTFHA